MLNPGKGGRMKILVVPKQFPHATVIGGPIIIFYRIKCLSKKHFVGLATFANEEEKKHLPTIAPYLKDVALLPHPKKRSLLRRLRDFFFSEVPPYMCNTKSEALKRKLGEMVRKEKYDVIIAEYTVMGQYVYKNEYLPPVKRIISCHESYTIARKLQWKLNKFSWKGIQALLQLKGLRKYEFAMYRDADKVLTLTPQEREGLLRYAPGLDIDVVPHGVNIEQFQYRDDDPKEEKSIMFLGNYPHEPNRDAVSLFYHECWPELKKRVPGVKFYIVGKDPTKDILEMARDPQVVVTGKVDDVRPYFRKAKVFICPVRMGKGFRGKVLEAMAMGVPVVSTALGAEGIPVKNRENIVIADEPGRFVDCIVELMENREFYAVIRRNARKLVEEKFSWEKGVEILEKILDKVVGKKGS
jgi:glycosyltransferase involved in cell wall biosynthesis